MLAEQVSVPPTRILLRGVRCEEIPDTHWIHKLYYIGTQFGWKRNKETQLHSRVIKLVLLGVGVSVSSAGNEELDAQDQKQMKHSFNNKLPSEFEHAI